VHKDIHRRAQTRTRARAQQTQAHTHAEAADSGEVDRGRRQRARGREARDEKRARANDARNTHRDADGGGGMQRKERNRTEKARAPTMLQPWRLSARGTAVGTREARCCAPHRWTRACASGGGSCCSRLSIRMPRPSACARSRRERAGADEKQRMPRRA
jgi:hypothetical protein